MDSVCPYNFWEALSASRPVWLPKKVELLYALLNNQLWSGCHYYQHNDTDRLSDLTENSLNFFLFNELHCCCGVYVDILLQWWGFIFFLKGEKCPHCCVWFMCECSGLSGCLTYKGYSINGWLFLLWNKFFLKWKKTPVGFAVCSFIGSDFGSINLKLFYVQLLHLVVSPWLNLLPWFRWVGQVVNLRLRSIQKELRYKKF